MMRIARIAGLVLVMAGWGLAGIQPALASDTKSAPPSPVGDREWVFDTGG